MIVRVEGPPIWASDPAALVIIDWSWWLHKAYALNDVDMVSTVVGWLCYLLANHPAHVCIALDSPGPTFRHRRQHPTNPDWRYKGTRPPKSDDFFALCRKATEIAELHSIPCLFADGYEGDDVAATVTIQARAAGYRVWNCSADKDLAALAEASDDPKVGILSGLWDNSTNVYRGPVEVFASYGVRPDQMTDMLALAGDSVDSIPGVEGIGAGKAADLLAQFGTLDAALLRAPWTPDEHARCADRIKSLAKSIVTLKKASKSYAAQQEERDSWMQLRKVAGYHAVLHASKDMALFSRTLTSLDCDAPISIPWYELPIGGFDEDALTERYKRVGYTRKAAQVSTFPKLAPWAVPWQ